MDKKVFFENSREEKLCGFLNVNSDNKQIVILVHGYASSKNNRTNSWLIDFLNLGKINSFRIDLSGCGESEGKFEDQTISAAVEDIKGAIDFVKTKDFEEIILLGISAGGISSIGATLENNDVKKLILLSPATNYVRQRIRKYGQKAIDDWKEKGFIIYPKGNGEQVKVNYSFFEDAKKILWLKKLIKLIALFYYFMALKILLLIVVIVENLHTPLKIVN